MRACPSRTARTKKIPTNSAEEAEIKMRSSKSKWKRRLLWTFLLGILLMGILTVLAFLRFHFSNQAFPRLARLQWNKQTDSEFHGVRPIIIGHRGSGIESTSPGLLIGNTSNAIQQSIDADVDWIEIDVRLSRDGHLVVFHDHTIDKKTTGKGAVGELDLQQLQAAEIRVSPPERIQSLDQVFTTFHSKQRKWIFDIKVPDIHKQVLRWIDEKVSKGKLLAEDVLIFGDYETLMDYKGCDYALGYTALGKNRRTRLNVLFTPSNIIKQCENLDCDYLVLPILFADQSLVKKANSAGLHVWVYGSDDERDLKYLAGHGISGLIVDRPKSAVDLFRNAE